MKRLFKVFIMLLIGSLILIGCLSNEKETIQTNGKDPSQTEKEEENSKEEVTEIKGEIKSQALVDLMNAKSYTMKMKQYTTVVDYKSESMITSVVADDQTYLLSDSEVASIEVIEKEDKSYLIMHETRSIIQTSRYENDEAEITEGTLVYDDLVYLNKGKEDFLGNNLSFQEYETEFGIVKYYFDGNDIAGMKMIMDMQKLADTDEEDEEVIFTDDAIIIIEILSYDTDVDMGVFELPSDYTIIGV